MKAHVVSKLKTLFNSISQFKIPPYQREYCWDKVQWQQLWDDLAEASDRGDSHFLGIAITVPLSSENRSFLENEVSAYRIFDQFLLVDGQQRMTTLLLLARAFEIELESQITFLKVSNKSGDRVLLREKLLTDIKSFLYNEKSGIKGEACLRISLSGSEQKDFNEVFSSIVNKNTGQRFKANVKKPTGSEKRGGSQFEKALKYFKARIEETGGKYTITSESDLDFQENLFTAYIDTLLNKLTLVVVELDRDETGDMAFERINAAGKHLESTDLLKNMLFSIEKQEILREHPGVSEDDRTYFPFSSLLESKSSGQLELGFKLYFQLIYGQLAPSKNRYCTLFEKAMHDNKTRLLLDMKIILAEIGLELTKVPKAYFDMGLLLRVAQKLIVSRELILSNETQALIKQLTILSSTPVLSKDHLAKSYLQVLLKLFSSILTGVSLTSDQLKQGRAYCVDSQGNLRLPDSFGDLKGNSLQEWMNNALEFYGVAYDIPSDQLSHYRAIPLLVNSFEDASLLSPGICWKEILNDFNTDVVVKTIANYILVPVDSAVEADSSIEEKFESAKLVNRPNLHFSDCSLDMLATYLDARKVALEMTFLKRHLDTFQYFDIEKE